MKKAVLALATAATIGVAALVTPSPAQAWRGGWGPGLAGGLIAGAVIGGIASSAYAYGPGYGYYGGPGYGYYGGYAPAYYGGYAPAYSYGYAPAYYSGYRSSYYAPAYYGPGYRRVVAPDTHTMAPGTIAVIVIDDDRQATLFQVCRHFPPRIGLWQKSTAARKIIVLDANTARSGNDLNWGPAVALRPPHGRLGCALLISTDGPEYRARANHDWSSHGADGFGLMCIHYDQPDGAPPSRERYSGGEARAAGRALGKARKSLPMSAK